jgi:hypothetical protein
VICKEDIRAPLISLFVLDKSPNSTLSFKNQSLPVKKPFEQLESLEPFQLFKQLKAPEFMF